MGDVGSAMWVGHQRKPSGAPRHQQMIRVFCIELVQLEHNLWKEKQEDDEGNEIAIIL